MQAFRTRKKDAGLRAISYICSAGVCEMPETAEIIIERQPGGWVWAALSPGNNGKASQVLAQSHEAFVTERAARADAFQSAVGGKPPKASEPLEALGAVLAAEQQELIAGRQKAVEAWHAIKSPLS
ncbi:hypothetical protein [Caballeronia calidae]|uniref:hypothetical protein n=1 Tax=Caballeronia calidae TaxID=1777139 RepID=UPI00078859C3|nr:hypothetical protein [Caballeronia calidae]